MKTINVKTLNGVVKVPENILNLSKTLKYTKKCDEFFGYFSLEPKLKTKYIYRGGGYNNKTNQISLNIALPKNLTEEGIEYAVDEILSFSQLLKEQNGYKSLSISENTLGENGCYVLEIYNKEIKIILWRHFNKSIIFKTTDLKKAIKEISTKYYRTVRDYDE